jgi:hypothetical protein
VEPCVLDFERTVEEFKRYKSRGIVQTPAELTHSGGKTVCPEIHKLLNYVWNKKELPQW